MLLIKLLFVIILIVVVILIVFALCYVVKWHTTTGTSATNKNSKCVLYSHRGKTKNGKEENSIVAFKQALVLGATAIETDVHLTKDGHVVLCHDKTSLCKDGVKRRINTVLLEHLSIDTLEEALRQIPVQFSVDIKFNHKEAPQKVIDIIYRHNAQNRVILTSFSSTTLNRIRQLEYKGKTGLSQTEVMEVILFPESRLQAYRGRVAQIPYTFFEINLANKTLVDKFHRLGMDVHYWTVNESCVAHHLLSLGVDALVTDDVETINKVIHIHSVGE